MGHHHIVNWKGARLYKPKVGLGSFVDKVLIKHNYGLIIDRAMVTSASKAVEQVGALILLCYLKALLYQAIIM